MKTKLLPALLAVLLGAAFCTLALRAQDKKGEDQIAIAVPLAVKYTIVKEAGGGKITGFTKEQHDGRTVYEATVSLDGREYEIRTSAEGHLLHMELKERDGDRRDPKLEDFPAPIKESLTKHSRGGEVKEVDMQPIAYSMKVKISGQHYRVIVDAAGHLVRKEPVDE